MTCWGEGMELLQSSVRSHTFSRCCRPLSLQSSPGSWAAIRCVALTQDYTHLKLWRGRCAATSALKRRNEPRPRPLLRALGAPPSIEKPLTFCTSSGFWDSSSFCTTTSRLHPPPSLNLSPSLPPSLCKFSAEWKSMRNSSPGPPTAPPSFAALHGWFTVCLSELMRSLGR